MATVSGCTLALLDAGVDLPGGPVAGVSVGLAPGLEGSRLLLDITGTEVRGGDLPVDFHFSPFCRYHYWTSHHDEHTFLRPFFRTTTEPWYARIPPV